MMRKLVLALTMILPVSAWATSGGQNTGIEIVPALFANQSTQNNGSGQTYRQMTTETDFHLDINYDWQHFFIGAVYDYGVVDAVNYAGNNTENKTTLQWAGPSVGVLLGDLRLRAGWVLYANDVVNNTASGGTATTYNYSSGSGPFGSISYSFHFGNKFFLAPTIDFYDITFTVGQTGTAAAGALTRNYEITGVAPFLGFGVQL